MMHLYSKQPFFERDQMLLSFPESLLQPVNKSITKPKVHAWRFRDR